MNTVMKLHNLAPSCQLLHLEFMKTSLVDSMSSAVCNKRVSKCLEMAVYTLTKSEMRIVE